ncbi:MAG: TAXI family TRAP transporter solute-binding subunit [Nitrososphaerales archaeon]
MSSKEKIPRREYLKYIGSFIIGAVIFGGGVAAYYASQPKVREVVTTTIKQTVPGPTVTTTVTVTATPSPSPTPTPKPSFPLPEWPKEVIIKVGGLGGAWYPIGAALGDLIDKELKVKATVQPGGSGPNILATSKGEVDLAMCYTFQSSLAKMNDISYFGEPVDFNKLKLVCGGIYTQLSHMVKDPKFVPNNFKELTDLVKQGKPARIGTNIRGTAEELTVRKLLEFYGVTYDDVRKAGGTVFLGPHTDIVTMMREGKIDVYVAFGGIGYSAMVDLDTTKEILPFHLTSQEMKYMVEKFGFTEGVLPKGSYRYAKDNIPSLRGDPVFICKASLPDTFVYHVARLLDEGKAYITAAAKYFAEYDPKTAVKNTGLWEWHPGALKYYKDKGYL